MIRHTHDPALRQRCSWLLAALVLGSVLLIAPWAAATEHAANGSHPGKGMWLAADTVYRSVDEHGNVTYSQRPPPEAEAVEPVQVEAGPDRDRRQAAQARARELRQAAQRLREAHEEEAAERRADVRAAEKALRQARARLERARIKHDEDWQGLAGGGRRLKPSYHQRVQAAEAQVEAAEKRLRAVRR